MRHYESVSDETGIATTAEYVLLLGVSIIIFFALAMATNAFSVTARDDATAIAAFGVASMLSHSICDAAGSEDVSVSMAIDLPERICGMPYLAYPSQDGRSILVSVSSGTITQRYSAPLPLRAYGVHFEGFIASTPGGHVVAYDAVSRTVALS